MPDARDFGYWRRELALIAAGFVPSRDRPYASEHLEHEAVCGFWRGYGARTKWDTPIAVWRTEEGADRYRSGTGATINEIPYWMWGPAWEWNAGAVMEDEYRQAIGTGYWPDGKPAKEMTAEQKLDIIAGDPTNQLHVQLDEKLKALITLAEAIKTIQTPVDAVVAAEALKRIKDLCAHGEKHRVIEKRPHLEAGNAVQKKWKDVLDPGVAAGNRLVALIGKYQKAVRDATGEVPRVSAALGRAIHVTVEKVGVIDDLTAYTEAIVKTNAFVEWCHQQANEYANVGIVINGMHIEEK